MKICEELYNTAKKEMGVEEIPGTKDNPRIEQYHSVTTLKATDDETPWCSSFVCWVVQQCGLYSTRSARALSWMNWGIPLNAPYKGCIVIFSRGGGQGHVGFFDHEDEKHVYVLGGNQSNRVCIAAYPKDRWLAYRGAPLPIEEVDLAKEHPV